MGNKKTLHLSHSLQLVCGRKIFKVFFIEMEIYCFLQLAFKKHAKCGVDYRAEGEMLEHSTITVGISVE